MDFLEKTCLEQTDVAPERSVSDTASVAVFGELDLSRVAELRERFAEPHVLNARAVRVDLRGVTFLDSVIIGVIVTACKRARAARRSFSVVCSSRGIVRSVFEIDGLVEYLQVEWPSANLSVG
jgi:anti-sigma B factor antagonist